MGLIADLPLCTTLPEGDEYLLPIVFDGEYIRTIKLSSIVKSIIDSVSNGQPILMSYTDKGIVFNKV